MNRQRAKELVPLFDLIKAFAEGKTIEFRTGSRPNDPWLETHDPAWTPGGEYRVKPEPEIVYINEYRYTTEEDAKRYALGPHFLRTRVFVEKTE